jgi:hypothetical protein
MMTVILSTLAGAVFHSKWRKRRFHFIYLFIPSEWLKKKSRKHTASRISGHCIYFILFLGFSIACAFDVGDG